MMQKSVLICLLSLTTPCLAFVPTNQRRFTPSRVLMAEDAVEEAGGKLVPIKEETVEFTAGIIGGIAGFAVGGPVLGAVVAAAANYASKTESDAGDIVSSVSKSSIEAYNYLAKLDTKYEVLTKANGSLEAALDKLKAEAGDNKEAIAKVESALETTQKKITELNDEYDLVGGAVTALGVAGELVEKAVKKFGELNEEYMLTSKATDALKSAIEKAKAAAAKSS